MYFYNITVNKVKIILKTDNSQFCEVFIMEKDTYSLTFFGIEERAVDLKLSGLIFILASPYSSCMILS